jgi:signal transduction histidine kinase
MGAREAEGLVLSLVDVTERKHAEMELERRNKELRELYEAESTARRVSEALSAASRTLSQSLDLHQVIQALLDNLGIILDFDAAGITILENQSHPAIRFSRGSKDRQISDSLPFIDVDEITDSLINRMHREKKSLVLPNSVHRTAASAGQTDETIHTWLVAPIDASDHIIGLVELGTSNEGNFSPERIRWAEALVSQASVAIQNALLFEEVRSSRERLQSLTRKLVQVQETERYHIARELHDEAGQALSSLKLSLGRLQQDPDCPGQIRDQLDDLKDLADGVLEELHRMAINLRPVVLDRLGIVAALEQYAHHLSVERLSIQFKSIGFEDERLPQDVETAIYRIVQEALTNVVRHSGARSVGVLMEWDEDTVKVFVEDDGIGISPDSIESKERLGLVGMRERAEMFGGNLTVESSSNEGTSIIVEVPVAHTNSNRR